jgi:hypothetical protein
MANLWNDIEVDPDMVCWAKAARSYDLRTDSQSQIDPSDTDYASSGYDTSSTSLSSTVNDYIFENGM